MGAYPKMQQTVREKLVQINNGKSKNNKYLGAVEDLEGKVEGQQAVFTFKYDGEELKVYYPAYQMLSEIKGEGGEMLKVDGDPWQNKVVYAILQRISAHCVNKAHPQKQGIDMEESIRIAQEKVSAMEAQVKEMKKPNKLKDGEITEVM